MLSGLNRPVIRRRLSIDLRALATFRTFAGILILADILMRFRNLRVFYTDSGVLPRSTLQEVFPILSSFSIHTVSGSATFQAVLFVATGISAVFLIVGYRKALPLSARQTAGTCICCLPRMVYTPPIRRYRRTSLSIFVDPLREKYKT